MRGIFLKAFILLVLAFATAGSAMAQLTNYLVTLPNPSCVGTTSCTFTFPAVSSANPAGQLVAQKVTCRILTLNSGVFYAALSKDINPSKVEFLPYATFSVGTSVINQIDANTLFFIQVGASPVIKFISIALISAPNPMIDQPTCTVAGYVD
jgi:hypothetical protein